MHPRPAREGRDNVPAAPAIDLEEARALARSGAQTSGSGAGSAGAEAVPSLAERPALPGLARKMGPPPVLVSEKMVGGNRLIRFRDGRCLEIPVNVPAWRESRVVPTEWVTTNCPP